MKNFVFDEALIIEGNAKKINGVTWQDIADYMNETYNYSYSESFYRRRYKILSSQENISSVEEEKCTQGDCASATDLDKEQFNDVLLEIKKEKVKLSDELMQNNAYVRQLAREETIKEIAFYFADAMNSKKMLPYVVNHIDGNNEAILQISDWHYGAVCDNYWNKFDPDICKFRVAQLCEIVKHKCAYNNVKELHIVNLSDLISGRIHLPLRISSRFDVITQVMQVAEILAEFIYELSNNFNVHYYDCTDNHSRIEPNKKESIDLESLTRIIKWYLVTRFEGNENIAIHNNTYGDDIVSFICKGWHIAGVHGDNDKQCDVIERLTMMTHESFDLVLTAHNHHFAADETNESVLLANGSLMGTDHYAAKLRKSSKPSQNLIIVTDRSPIDDICRIVLD